MHDTQKRVAVVEVQDVGLSVLLANGFGDEHTCKPNNVAFSAGVYKQHSLSFFLVRWCVGTEENNFRQTV